MTARPAAPPCGDLVRIGVAVDGDRVADAGFEASGCGAAIAAGSAAVELVRGAPRPRRRARRHARDLRRARRPEPRQAPRRRARRRRAARARSGAAVARRRGAPRADPERTLVAMSGGVDSRRRRAAQRRRDAATVTLELWRDPDNDAERSCCSASAVRGARALAHGMGLAHFTARPARRVPRRRRRAVAGRPRRRPDAQPVRALQRQRAPRRDARLRRPPRRRDADHRPLRAPHARRPAAPGRRPGQGPGLHARRRCRARRSRGCASRSATSTKAAGARDRRRARAAGRLQARLAGPVLPRRHRARGASSPATAACGERPGDIVDAAGRVARPPPRRATTSPSASAAASRSAATPEPLYVLRTDAGANTVTVGPRAALATTGVARPRRAPARAGRRGRRRQAALPRAGRAVHAARRRRSSSPSPSTAPPRARPRSSCAATPCWDAPQSLRDLRRDPRALPGLLRGARPPAPAQSASLVPASFDPSVLLTTAGMQPLKPYFLGIEKPPHHRSHDLPEVLPHGRHRERRHRRRGT